MRKNTDKNSFYQQILKRAPLHVEIVKSSTKNIDLAYDVDVEKLLTDDSFDFKKDRSGDGEK